MHRDVTSACFCRGLSIKKQEHNTLAHQLRGSTVISKANVVRLIGCLKAIFNVRPVHVQ